MNWFKDKTFCILLFIGVALVLGGILLIYVPELPLKLLPFMSTAGGGVIGIAIALKLKNRPRVNHKRHGNNLKRHAQKNFLFLILISAFGFFIFGFLTYTNVKGTPMLIGCFAMIASMGIGAVISIFNKKKQPLPGFDERELYLLQHASLISNSWFICYSVAVMLIAFSLIGGRGAVPMWSVPVALYVGLLFSGTVQFLVLMHHAKEDDKIAKGGGDEQGPAQ